MYNATKRIFLAGISESLAVKRLYSSLLAVFFAWAPISFASTNGQNSAAQKRTSHTCDSRRNNLYSNAGEPAHQKAHTQLKQEAGRLKNKATDVGPTTTSALSVKENSAFSKIRKNPKLLDEFLSKMPKGAELHIHLSGIPSPDELLEIAANEKQVQYFVQIPKTKNYEEDPKAFALTAMPLQTTISDPNMVPVGSLLHPANAQVNSLRAKFCDAMCAKESELNARRKFCTVTFQRRRDLVRTLSAAQKIVELAVKKANAQNLIYVEIQVDPSFVDPAKASVGTNSQTERTEFKTSPLAISRLKQNLLALQQAVLRANEKIPSSNEVKVRFLISLNRENPGVFQKLPLAFQLATDPELSEIVAGINICGDEFADRNFAKEQIANSTKLQETISRLHKTNPTVKLSIHAGESLEWNNHVVEALNMGASRIGHGVNLSCLNESASAACHRLASKQILIESCPYSNAALLRLPIAQHPSINYLRRGIPVSISSDDPGIFQTNITTEFKKLIETHPNLSWSDLKSLCRNSLIAAFLPQKERAKLLAKFDRQLSYFSRQIFHLQK